MWSPSSQYPGGLQALNSDPKKMTRVHLTTMTLGPNQSRRFPPMFGQIEFTMAPAALTTPNWVRLHKRGQEQERGKRTWGWFRALRWETFGHSWLYQQGEGTKSSVWNTIYKLGIGEMKNQKLKSCCEAALWCKFFAAKHFYLIRYVPAPMSGQCTAVSSER